MLALGQRPFRPTDLANQIINLAGKRHALENERQFRLELAASQTLLESKRKAYDVQFQREERELQEIANRGHSREQHAAAAKTWDLFLAIGAILDHEAAEAQAAKVVELEHKIQETEDAITQKRTQLRDLPDRATLIARLDLAKRRRDGASEARDKLIKESGAKQTRKEQLDQEQTRLQRLSSIAAGISIDEARARLETAEERRLETRAKTALVERHCQEKGEQLAKLKKGRGGPAGPALEALEAEGIHAVSVLDLINLNEESRAHGEARLSPYINAIILTNINNTLVDRARKLLANHPGIPVIIGTAVTPPPGSHDADLGDTAPDSCWFVMPLASSTARAKATELQEPEQLKGLLTAACEALRVPHTKGWIHRDLKPDNLLMLDGHWVVADWGLARRPRGTTSEPGRTRTGTGYGTEGFAAPELSLDAHRVGPQADIYSLGQIVGSILTGRSPQANIPLIPSFGPWAEIVSRATQHDAAKRPNSVDVFLDHLDSLDCTSHRSM